MQKIYALIIIIFHTFFILGSCNVTHAKHLNYIKTSLGIGASNKLDTHNYGKRRLTKSVIWHLAVGRQLTKQFALDFGMFFTNKQKFDHHVEDDHIKQTFKSKTLMLSSHYDLTTSYLVIPFISFGLGVSNNTAGNYIVVNKGSQDKKTVKAIAYTFAGGVKYRKERMEIFLEYRHLNLGKFSTSNIIRAVGSSTTTVDAPIKARLGYNTINLGFKVLF